MTGQDMTGQDRTGQDRTGQDRTGQDRTGQDRCTQTSTSTWCREWLAESAPSSHCQVGGTAGSSPDQGNMLPAVAGAVTPFFLVNLLLQAK
jgi:hypothetical protein